MFLLRLLVQILTRLNNKQIRLWAQRYVNWLKMQLGEKDRKVNGQEDRGREIN